MPLRIIYNLAFLLYFPLFTAAQLVKRYNTFSYSVNNGLLQSSILDMAFDKNNYCWIAFPNGIQKFDGSSFTNIPVQNGLPDDKFVSFLRLSSGDLLIKHAQGISLYNVASNYFIQVAKLNKTQAKGTVFLGEYNHVVYLWNYYDEIVGLDATGSFKEVSKTPLIFPSSIIRDDYKYFSNITQGKIILCQGNFLILWNFTQPTHATKSIIIDDVLPSSIYLNSSNEAIFFLKTQKGILYSINFTNGKTSSLKNLSTITAKRDLRSFIQCWDNKLVYVFDNKIYESDANSLYPKSEILNFQGQPISTSSAISRIKVDNFGNLIASTIQDGIRKIIKNNFPINIYSDSHAENKFVNCVLPDKVNNKILAGIRGDGLIIFDTLQQVKKTIKFFPKIKHNTTPVAIIKNLVGDYLIFLWGEKIVWKLTKNLSQLSPITIFCSDTTINPAVKYYTKTDYLDDHTALIASQNNIYKINLVRNTIHCYTFTKDHPMSALVYNQYIISHVNDSLFFLDTASIKIVKKIYFPNTAGVRSFVKGPNAEIFMGTNKGVFKIDTTGKTLQHWDKKWGLPDECIYAIEVDKLGQLWCSTNKGIIRISKNNLVLNLTRQDGLQENEFNTNVSAVDKDREMFLGGVKGISSFYPQNIVAITENISILLTDIKSNGINIFGDSAIWKIKKITLPYNLNSLSFDFIAIGPQNPDQYFYNYRMKGFDGSWIQLLNQQAIRYLLPPGKYVLQVSASRSLDKNPIPLKEIYIVINPPFWQTWWFITGIIFLSLLITIGGVYFYLRSKFKHKLKALEEEQKMQVERERISRNLHDSVGAYANAVLYNTQLLEEEKEESKKTLLMTDLKYASKDIITALRETIWALKKEKYSAEECLMRLKNFIQPFNRYYPTKSFFIKGNAPAGYYLHYSKALNLVRIVQEALSNAIKHSNASNLIINSFEENNKWVIEVIDNGNGFVYNKEFNSAGYGLENMKKRSQEAGFELGIFSNDTGTTIRIIVV